MAGHVGRFEGLEVPAVLQVASCNNGNKIRWASPTSTSVSKIYVYKVSAPGKAFDNYEKIDEVYATSDGNPKTSANTWVTEWLDLTGNIFDWYKLSFYDGTYESGLSNSFQSNLQYCNARHVYAKTGLSISEVSEENMAYHIRGAETEVESSTGRSWSAGNSVTEYFSGPRKDMFDNKSYTVLLSNYPVQSITQFQILNSDGSVNTSYTALSTNEIRSGVYRTSEYWLDYKTGIVSFISNTIPEAMSNLNGTGVIQPSFKNVKIVYTYGFDSVPSNVSELTACLAGIRAWISFLGGNYNCINSFSVPESNVNKGDFFARGKMMIDQLTDEANRLYANIGKRSDVMVIST
jgi:hypothetical protein